MKKKIKKDKEEPFKISATIYTNEELEKLDHKIEIDLDNIVNQVTEAVFTKREEIVLQKVIEKQQKEIEKLKSKKYIFNAVTNEIKEIPISENYISKDKIREKIKELKQYKEEIKEEKDFEYFNALRIIRVLKALLGE